MGPASKILLFLSLLVVVVAIAAPPGRRTRWPLSRAHSGFGERGGGCLENLPAHVEPRAAAAHHRRRLPKKPRRI